MDNFTLNLLQALLDEEVVMTFEKNIWESMQEDLRQNQWGYSRVTDHCSQSA